MRPRLGREAGARVAHRNGETSLDAAGSNRDLRASRGVTERVVEQIVHDLAQAVRVAIERQRADASRHRRTPRLSARDACPSTASRAIAARSQGMRSNAITPASARDSVSSPCTRRPRRSISGEARGERLAVLVRRAQPAQRHLDRAAEVRERRPQLVRCVGDEASLRREGGFETCQHRVEDGGQLAQLPSGRDLGNARVEVLLADRVGGLGDGVERARESAPARRPRTRPRRFRRPTRARGRQHGGERVRERQCRDGHDGHQRPSREVAQGVVYHPVRRARPFGIPEHGGAAERTRQQGGVGLETAPFGQVPGAGTIRPTPS